MIHKEKYNNFRKQDRNLLKTLSNRGENNGFYSNQINSQKNSQKITNSGTEFANK
jgi:hypothetical protein